MSLDLSTLRAYARDFSRNAGDQTYYNTAQIDRAIFFICADFVQVVRLVKLEVEIDFVAATNSADFSSLSGFMPDRIERIRVIEDDNYTDISDDLDITDAGEVLDRINSDSGTGAPTMIGFSDSTTATFYPTPSDNGSLDVVYCPLQESWQMGTRGAYSVTAIYYVDDLVSSGGVIYKSLITSNVGHAVSDTASWESQGAGTLSTPSSIVSTIDDSLLVMLLGYGVGPALQWTDPEHGYASSAWARYEKWRDSKRGIGSISGRVSFRKSLADLRE